MKVAAVQFVSGGEIDANLSRAKELISTAAGKGAKLIVLPEATAQSFASGRLDSQAQELDGDFASQLKAHAQSLGVTVVAGMFRPADNVDKDGKTINRVYNTALITGPGVHLGYNKIHTYDAFKLAVGEPEKIFESRTEKLMIIEIGGELQVPSGFYNVSGLKIKGTPAIPSMLRDATLRSKACSQANTQPTWATLLYSPTVEES